MLSTNLLPPEPIKVLFSVLERLGIAAVVGLLLWSLLMYGFQFVVGRLSKQPLTTDKHAETTGICGIVFSILSSLALIFVLPKVSSDPLIVTNLILWYHRFGVALLGTFLLLALLLQLRFMFQLKHINDIQQVRRMFSLWLWITETMPGPAAIIILCTGLQRVAAVPGYSLNQMWILFLVAILAIMMADGIFSYTPAIRNLAILSERSGNIHVFLRDSKNPARNCKLFVHSLSFPIVLTFPVWRIGSNFNLTKPLFEWLHLNQTQGGWKQLLPAVILFGALFVTVAAMNNWGRTNLKASVKSPVA